jgi:hypothetical protein
MYFWMFLWDSVFRFAQMLESGNSCREHFARQPEI